MARTTATLVQGILGGDWDGSTSLDGYIATATAVADRLNDCADDKGYTLSSTELELIERWLAAHFYTIMDPIYVKKRTERAEGHFQERSYLDATKMLDPSGCVNAVMSGVNAGMFWGGKNPSDQIDYEDRR